MNGAGAPDDSRQYRAFISYSHADSRFALWLHRKIERFAIPAGPGAGRVRLAPVFLDRAELPAATDLSATVRAALARSAALIVIASPHARASRWVDREIALFRELHPDRPVLVALIEGEPDTAFPPALTGSGAATIEPLAADFRKGADGRRLGLLKIVAGLSGQPLDRLVQRDAQARQRRVMAVTAAALLLSLVLAGLLVLAIQARAEAERQRAEAEGLVEFMLTDLRDKLKGVGRLEVMDAVNERAMLRYASERDLSRLPAETLERRARLLLAMAEDDLESVGKRDLAAAKVAEAHRATADLLAREPDNPDRIFAHAQSEYWQGYIAYRAARRGNKALFAATERHWLAYRGLAGRLIAAAPADPRGRREVGYAEGNLCTLMLERSDQLMDAVARCRAARLTMAAIARAAPNDIAAQLSHANRLAWEADALAAAGDAPAALAMRREQALLTAGFAARWPRDARVQEAAMLAEIGLTRALAAAGQGQAAQASRSRVAIMAQRLRRLDPANANWQQWDRELRLAATGHPAPSTTTPTGD